MTTRACLTCRHWILTGGVPLVRNPRTGEMQVDWLYGRCQAHPINVAAREAWRAWEDERILPPRPVETREDYLCPKYEADP